MASGPITHAPDTGDNAPRLTADQRARTRYSFLLDTITGRYVIADYTDTGDRAFLVDNGSGVLVLSELEGGSQRLVLNSDGRFTA